jgi:hypothetical protein
MILRALAIIVLVFLLASGLIFVISDNMRTGLVESPGAVATSTAPVVATTTPDFVATGIINYYPNNLGTMIPYLVYQKPSGATATKALTYCGIPAGQYTGDVRVEGELEESTVCVDSITPA